MKAIQTMVIISAIALADNPPDTLWTVYEDNPYLEYAVDGVLTQDGCYAMTGTSDSLLTLRIFNSEGTEVLSRLYEVPNAYLVYANSIDQLNDGGFLIAGVSGDNCGVLIRTDAAADTLWTGIFPDIDPYGSIDVLAASDGGYLLMYEIPGTLPNAIDIKLQKYHSDDSLEWEVVNDNYSRNNSGWIGEETDGSLVVACHGAETTGPSVIFLVKYDSGGSELWTQEYSSTICPYVSTNDCCRTTDGGYCIVGQYSFNSIMLKVDADGNEEWRKEYQGTRSLQSISTLGNGNLVAGGFAGSFQNAFLFAVNSIGETLWESILSIPGHNFECVSSILYDENTEQFLVSALTATVLNGPSDYWLMCYSSVLAGCSSQEGYTPEALCITGITPNPFTFSTEICFFAGEPGQTEVAIYDLSGHRVRTLYNGSLPGGETRINWDCRNEIGATVQPGVYFCSLSRAGFVSSRRMVLTDQ